MNDQGVSVALNKGDFSFKTEPNVKWYAIYVRSRFEKKVHTRLLQQNIETYLPLIEVVRLWSDRKKRIQEPLFKGYLFVRINIREKLNVLKADGVVKFIGIKDMPSAISDDQINLIKNILHSGESLKREKYPAIGERVEVVAGPLRGIRGIVSQVRGSTKLIILVDAISRAFSAEVQPEFLKVMG
ncbi:MAG: UpxY family transcription antiterminator [Bacteroidota bacterium]|jgi:transcription antitermination factor NusG